MTTNPPAPKRRRPMATLGSVLGAAFEIGIAASCVFFAIGNIRDGEYGWLLLDLALGAVSAYWAAGFIRTARSAAREARP